MAAGLGFKTFVTGDVLTAADTNGYLMQGINVFANAAARDAAITSPQEGQACYLKDTDAVMTYSGTAWITTNVNAIMTTTGDMLYRNATVPVRLGIGTAGQVLAVNSGANAPEWVAAASGGLTLLSTTTLSGVSTSVTVAPTGYKNLVAYIYGGTLASGNFNYNVRINGITTATYLNMNSSCVAGGTLLNTGGDTSAIDLNQPGNISVASGGLNSFNLTFWDCNSNEKKNVTVNGSYINMNAVNVIMNNRVSVLSATSAITNITVISNTALTGGTIQVYGQK